METRPRNFAQSGIKAQRWQILQRLEDWLETPMVLLAFVWLGLLVLEFAYGEQAWVRVSGTVIWIIFCIDFLVRLAIAPSKLWFLRKNLLTTFSLVLPALRVVRVVAILRVARLTRVARGLRLVRVLSSVNRGMRALSVTMRRRGFGYVVALTLVVTAAGAAGMLAFERDAVEAGGIHSYGEALWWTAMIITTMGTDYWPQTLEGRLLCLFLALYAFAVFGYVTATIATFFIGKDTRHEKQPAVSEGELLRSEIAALRQELRTRRGREEG